MFTPLSATPSVEGVRHSIEIKPETQGVKGAFRLDDLCYREIIGSQSEVQCPICGAMMAIPYGGVKEFLQYHKAALGGDDAFVAVIFHHKGPFTPTHERG